MADNAKPERVSFDDFVSARSSALLRTAYLLVRDQAAAEDLVQTALTKAWFAWDRLEGNPEPYVRRILVTTQASWWRRRWVWELPTADLPESGVGSAQDDAADGQDLWEALGHLPPRQRAVVVLRYFDDLTEVDTARTLNCSVGTVKSQCAKALAKLRVDATLQPVGED
jgi:RNA polymerase sigma-70 factor (sigma-E family)